MFHGRKRLATAASWLALVAGVGTGRARSRAAGPGRARHRRRAGSRRHPLPRGRAGLRAAERRQARAGRAARRHGLAPGRPGPPGHQAGVGPRGPPGLDHQPVRRPEPLCGRRGRQHRRRQLLRLEPLDDVGVQRPAGAALRLLHHRGQGAQHPPEGDRRSAPRRSRRSRTSSPPRRRRSTTKLAAAKDLLEDLKAEEREALLSRGSVEMPSGVDASGRAAIAIRYAMAQVGKSYVYGAAGPNSFDCSGLMMMAWAQAGISLPHSSGAQYGVGRHVGLERPPARRPGLLLLADQPRRDVHRQRPDRRGGQPRCRRPRGRRLLDAVRRRDPTRSDRSGSTPADTLASCRVAVRGCSAAPSRRWSWWSRWWPTCWCGPTRTSHPRRRARSRSRTRPGPRRSSSSWRTP